MLRVAIADESGRRSLYQTVGSTGSDTVMDILTRQKIDPRTKNIFVNGTLINEFDQPLKKYGSTTVFITIRYKTIDKPRRASHK